MTGPGQQQHRKSTAAGHRPVRLLAGLVLCCLLWLPAMADSVRIGYVDMKRLFDTMPHLVAAREELDREFRPRNEALLSDEAELERMQRELSDSPALDEQQRVQREREINNMRRSIERRREDLVEEIRFRTNAKTEALRETIDVAVREIAREEGYDLVLSNPVAYASDTVDITKQVLEWLEDDFGSGDNQRDP
ncbi:OmpH family outer membrane protein [Wenzhouxiangella sp. AB-CW3]|uniref:OmpH family outer membrane protein n=1 Tax=Wenzhouxiangella sp. AB-CW3 TaxID=2771012 RepID=UPI00168B28DA|nr:OmpH family outer membrane protein [Wenzhouxiangella sp. AB-CW3]QOC22998.1 OmpH family outer membrane protein [Wenzhouxiangella sp. AB-CW3]